MFLINLQGKESIYEQIRSQIERFIKAGILKADDKLPSVRSLAEELGINPNTVMKAYQELEKNGYIYTLNKKGVFVSRDVNAKDENITAGLFVYPPLMAADILLYDADYVPVGEDQKQHVELTRDLAQRFNNRYSETFVVPEPLVAKVGARIMSLSDPTKKMSKSEETNKGCIYLLDDINIAKKKIMSAVTDMCAHVNYDKENQPGVSNLLEIMSSLSGEPIDSIVARYEGKGYGEFKKEVAEVVAKELTMIQGRYNEIMKSGLIEQVLKEGAEKAHRIAFKKLKKVQKKMGIDIF